MNTTSLLWNAEAYGLDSETLEALVEELKAESDYRHRLALVRR